MHKITLIKELTGEEIGVIELNIIPYPVNYQDVSKVVPDLYTLIGVILILVVILGFIITILKYFKQN